MQVGDDILPAVRGENGPVGPRRSVECDLFFHQTLVRRLLRISVAEHDEGRRRICKVFTFSAGFAHTFFRPRKNRLAEIPGTVEGVHVQTVADLAGQAAHVLVYTGDVDWNPWMLDRAGIEHWC